MMTFGKEDPSLCRGINDGVYLICYGDMIPRLSLHSASGITPSSGMTPVDGYPENVSAIILGSCLVLSSLGVHTGL
jgi:hypothetical protein